jgi:hypothetical protein
VDDRETDMTGQKMKETERGAESQEAECPARLNRSPVSHDQNHSDEQENEQPSRGEVTSHSRVPGEVDRRPCRAECEIETSTREDAESGAGSPAEKRDQHPVHGSESHSSEDQASERPVDELETGSGGDEEHRRHRQESPTAQPPNEWREDRTREDDRDQAEQDQPPALIDDEDEIGDEHARYLEAEDDGERHSESGPPGDIRRHTR